jgi:photosystem II stability/assembly factor-like uncharacterized protein
MHLAPAILPTMGFVFPFCSCYCAEGRDELAKNDREEHKEKGVMKTENGSHLPERSLIKKRGWRQSFTILVAILCVIVVAGSFLLFLNYMHYGNNRASMTATTQGLGADKTLWWSLRMTSESIGWAYVMLRTVETTPSSGGTPSWHWAIVRTVDGGHNWQKVHLPYPEPRAPVFVTGDVAWTLAGQLNGSAYNEHLLHSINGGQTWQEVPIRDIHPQRIAVVSEQEVWLLGQNTLLHTVDGGRTWQQKDMTVLPKVTDWGFEPFLDGSVGWAENYVGLGEAALPALSVTHDLGRTWVQHTFPAPPGSSLPFSRNRSVMFFSANEGIFAVIYNSFGTSNPQRLMFYVTHDGGKSWQRGMPISTPNAMFVAQKGKDVATPTVSAYCAPLSSVQFFDSKHWLVYIYSTCTNREGKQTFEEVTLYETSDAGQHWSLSHPKSDIPTLDGFSFVSARVGWALGGGTPTGTGAPEEDNHEILKTIDGGHTWKKVPFSIT